MNKQYNKIKTFLWILLLEIIVIVFLFPFDTINSTLQAEKQSYFRTYGHESTYQILERATMADKAILHDTGAIKALHELFSPQAVRDILADSPTLLTVNSFQESRILAAEKVFLIFLTRLSSMFEWVPFVSVFMLSMFLNAYYNWKIKKTKFGAPSVALHYYAKNTAHYTLMVFFWALILPIQMAPELFPTIAFTYFVFLAITSATLSKSI